MKCFLLGNLIYERGIKFQDLLNNKIIQKFGGQNFFVTNCEIFHDFILIFAYVFYD